MEGNEKITLKQPSTIKRDNVGQQQDDYKEIIVYARRQDRGGREGVYSDTRGGQWQSRFEIRATPSLLKVSEEWQLIDGYNSPHNIEAVSFAPYWGGRRFIWIYTIRTERKNGNGI